MFGLFKGKKTARKFNRLMADLARMTIRRNNLVRLLDEERTKTNQLLADLAQMTRFRDHAHTRANAKTSELIAMRKDMEVLAHSANTLHDRLRYLVKPT